MTSGSSTHPTARIKTLQEEARAIRLWFEEYEEKRLTHSAEEDAAYESKKLRYQRIIKEMYLLSEPKQPQRTSKS